MSDRSDVITLSQLPRTVNDAVQKALKESGFDKVKVKPRWRPWPGVLGFVLSRADLKGKSFSEIDELTTAVTKQLPRGMAGPRGVVLGPRDGTTLGFWPGPDIIEF